MSWDDATKTCKAYANYHFKVIYAHTGFTQKPQKYIVSVEQSTIETQWMFNRKDDATKQAFDVGVSF